MKLDDYVRRSIWEYPSLFKDVDYARSELKVLNQVFLVLGNGLELADTGDPSNGGFYVRPVLKRVDGEWQRLKDKPYGVEKFRNLPRNYFRHPVYYISNGKNHFDAWSYTKGKDMRGHRKMYVVIESPLPDDSVGHDDSPAGVLRSLMDGPFLHEACSRNELRPYPFAYEHSAFKHLDNGGFLQQDWLAGLYRISMFALSYYNDGERMKSDSSHPLVQLKRDATHWLEVAARGVDAIRSLRKTWGYADGDSVPSEEESIERATASFNKHLAARKSVLSRFIDKYESGGFTK